MNAYDYLAALNAMDPNNYEEYSSITLVDPSRSIEDLVIKKDIYEKLSPEAKDVINVVVERPVEFVLFAWANSSSYIKHRTYKHKPKHVYDRRENTNKYTATMENRLRDPSIIQNFFGWGANKWAEIKEEITEFCY